MNLKTICITAITGMFIAGLLAIIVSEIDHYYDWLLVKQSILLGTIAGVAAGIGICYYQKMKQGKNRPNILSQSGKEVKSSPITSEKPGEANTIDIKTPKKNKIGFWGMFARFGLGGLLGLLLGLSGGIWYCADLYGNLSSDAQAWIIFYIPFYAVAVLFFAALGCGTGAGLGLLFGLVRSSKN